MSRIPLREDANRISMRDAVRPVLDPKILAAIRGESEDKDFFGYDLSKKPIDMAYEGKRLTVAGWEDKRHQADLKRRGWNCVPADRHPECATDDPANKIIVVGGLALMERHEEYSRIAQNEVTKANNDQIKGQYERLKLGDDPSMPSTVTAFKQTYESGQEVPD